MTANPEPHCPTQREISENGARGCTSSIHMPGGRSICGKPGHHSDADVAYLERANEGGLRVGLREFSGGRGPFGKELAWPYGPNVDAAMRPAMVEWAESHGIQYARNQRKCLRWLTTGRCGCHRADQMTSNHLQGASWADHLTSWVRSGPGQKPAALISQPYGLEAHAIEDAQRVADSHGLRLEILSHGWYAAGGHGTSYIAFWNDSTEAGDDLGAAPR